MSSGTKTKIKNEKIFNRFAVDPKNSTLEEECDCVCCRMERATPTERGRKQFFDKQSTGKDPIYYVHHPYHFPPEYDPDDYYLHLMHGKERYELTIGQYRELYYSDDWWGFWLVWKDWKGERYILPLLFQWHPDLPSWFGNEDKDLTDKELMELTVGGRTSL